MNEIILELKATLEACFDGQSYYTALWHEREPEMPDRNDDYTMESLRNLVLLQHYYNFSLWHIEDIARRKDLDDAIIADCKRKIDSLNQKRNDCIELVDQCLYSVILPALPKNSTPRQNTETAGMAIDRLSILALKIYHMDEQTKRDEAGKEHMKASAEKLTVLQRQRRNLAQAVLELISDYAQGDKVPVLYSQFKMYNDPSLNPELYDRPAKNA